MVEILVRPLERDDRPEWEKLWGEYLVFYEQELAAGVTEDLFERLLSPASHRAFVAEIDGNVVGLVHYLFHDSTWTSDRVCYLEDLYVSPDIRGGGVGGKLIEAVYAAADAESNASGKVYWHTDQKNKRAQVLYDRIGELSDSIRYVRPKDGAAGR
ncbi:GNAT family N-acetyltransferase [Roseibium sp. MMSF_3544]|uniref:GNAT family N-acetyltransferase n=1 Tax=unclassified Roseibium TaxID=2629323 RepID=UPI00273DA807|nr:GNAT family N-acetyltransferase [Roseibium sp. MMSF_3544]